MTLLQAQVYMNISWDGAYIPSFLSKSTQEKKIYKLLMSNIKSGTENLIPLPKINNKGRNPIYFSKRVQKRTYDLSAWSESVMESVSQGGLSSPIFHLHYRFEPGAIPLSVGKVKCYLQPSIVGSLSWSKWNGTDESLWGSLRIYLNWNYPSSLQVKNTLVTKTSQPLAGSQPTFLS